MNCDKCGEPIRRNHQNAPISNVQRVSRKHFGGISWFGHGRVWAAVLVAFLLVVSFSVAAWQWNWLSAGGPAGSANSDTLRNVGFLVAGVLAAAFAVWRAWVAERQANAAREQANIALNSLLNDQYQRGAEMLSSDVLTVRLAGIYALQTLAEQHPEGYHLQIIRLFCVFVRRPTKDDVLDRWTYIEGDEIPPDIRDDAQAALSAIGHRGIAGHQLEIEDGFTLDLRGANLRGAHLRQCRLDRADLEWTHLTEADLTHASLAGARLAYADLSGATLKCADFQGSTCRLAKINRAKAYGTNFAGANLDGTIWTRAELENARLSFATLRGADLVGAKIAGVDVSGTLFGQGGRRHESWDPNLGVMVGSELAYTSLTQDQLDRAIAAQDCPPKIEHGMSDAETGVDLVWQSQFGS